LRDLVALLTNGFFMRNARKIFSILSNKYLIAITIFAVVMLITDHNNIFEQLSRKQELKELQDRKKYYKEEIEKTKQGLADLSNNAAALEKYAREKFYMKRDNEDVFVVENPKDSLK
jgi:cell division protein DivIC